MEITVFEKIHHLLSLHLKIAGLREE